jgi:hypothetical protein
MSALAIQILRPAHGTGFADAAPVSLQASLSGDVTGLFFKWFSSLNSAASATHPELNTADHSQAILNWNAAVAEFGSHVLVLEATDQDGIDLPSIKAVTRSAMAGGAPPTAPLPCVIHRLVAQIRTPSADGQSLSKSSTTLEVLAPVRWAKEDPAHPGTWIADPDYQAINGIGLAFRLAPAGAADPAHSADIPLVLASQSFFRADDKTWFRWTGALPANLKAGLLPPDPTASCYTLTLTVTGGGASTATTSQVYITA